MAKGIDALKALEKKLAEMTDTQLVSYFTEGSMKGYTPPMLYISIADSEAAPYQSKADFANNDRDAVNYELNLQCEANLLTKVKYDPKFWIASLWGIDKGRLHPGTNVKMMRPVQENRMLNAALSRSPDHWVVTFPIVNGMTSKVPLYATHFCVADYTGAYGTAINRASRLQAFIGVSARWSTVPGHRDAPMPSSKCIVLERTHLRYFQHRSGAILGTNVRRICGRLGYFWNQ